jgi:hypothetical protein
MRPTESSLPTSLNFSDPRRATTDRGHGAHQREAEHHLNFRHSVVVPSPLYDPLNISAIAMAYLPDILERTNRA